MIGLLPPIRRSSVNNPFLLKSINLFPLRKRTKGLPACAPAGGSEHPKNMVYRCCLPTLAGLTRSRHPDANAQHACREPSRSLPFLTGRTRKILGASGQGKPDRLETRFPRAGNGEQLRNRSLHHGIHRIHGNRQNDFKAEPPFNLTSSRTAIKSKSERN